MRSRSNHSMERIVQSYLSGLEMAGHWISATCSWLISCFHNFTSHFSSFASSRKIQITNHGAVPASRDAVSPDPISVGVDVSWPMNDQARTFTSSQSGLVHPIAVLFRIQELGKVALGFGVPMTTGLLFNQQQGLTHLQASAVALALSVGFAATWNGMLLRRTCPRVARALEHFGVACILVAFFGLVSSFLPPSLVWACWLCCGLSCFPFLLSIVPPTAAEGERSVEWLDQGIV